MLANKRRDTNPEMAIRRLAHAAGLRYRVDAKPLPDLNRRADMVFTRARVAVFIDGCYWHGCPEHGTTATTNSAYWGAKIKGNRQRDEDTVRRLREQGWVVVRIWEHDDPRDAVQKLVSIVRAADHHR